MNLSLLFALSLSQDEDDEETEVFGFGGNVSFFKRKFSGVNNLGATLLSLATSALIIVQ